MQRRLSLVASVILIVSASAASAQEKGHIGLVMGYPGAVGVLWHPTDGVAVRPTLSFSFSSIDRSTALPTIPIELGLGNVVSESESHTTSRQLGFGLSALFYLSRADSLSTYISPRFSYTRLDANTDPSSPYVDSDSSSSSSSAGGFFGIQYAMNKRFAVFGEVGFEYTRFKPPPTVFSTGRTIGARTATDVGMVLYFGK